LSVTRFGTRSAYRWGFARSTAPHPKNFGAFYLAYYPRILRYFAYHTRDAQLSLDLCMETFAKAFEARERFRGTTSKEAVGWLWAIARNELRQHERGRTTEATALYRLGMTRTQASDEELDLIVERATLERERGVLYDAWAQLTQKQRDVIQMRVVEERKYEDIAAKLNVSTKVIEKRLSSGLRRLAGNAALRRLGGDDR
jgi:RNA polymerase sigma-70 factor (ECF subfamily)